MFTFQDGDYKYVFEYDTPEEFELYLKEIKSSHEEILRKKIEFASANAIVKQELESPNPTSPTSIAWADLEIKFIAAKKKAGKLGSSTYKAYESTFKKLKGHFEWKPISEIDIPDYEIFQEVLKTKYGLANKTINGHMAYVNLFLNWGIVHKLIKENNVRAVENMAEDNIDRENFTDDEVIRILKYSYDKPYREVFLIAAYTGMRASEIIKLTANSVKESSNGIYYFSIPDAKTDSGVRDIPIHKFILNLVLDMSFPLFPNDSVNAAEKKILRRLYKCIKNGEGKFMHTFRGTLISKLLEKNYDKILVIKDIVGHSQGENSLTIDTYGRGFSLDLKKDIINSVSYGIE